MSFDGHAASSSGCAIEPKGHETGLTGFAGQTPISSPNGSYALATAEHRKPCESRGSCTILGAPGGETPPGDSPPLAHLYQHYFCEYGDLDREIITLRNSIGRWINPYRIDDYIGREIGSGSDLGVANE
jgi:hypothetical protein